MSIPGKRVLTLGQMAGYEALGFVHSVRWLHEGGTPVAVVRGSVGPQPWSHLSSKPADLPLEGAVTACRASGRPVLCVAS